MNRASCLSLVMAFSLAGCAEVVPIESGQPESGGTPCVGAQCTEGLALPPTGSESVPPSMNSPGNAPPAAPPIAPPPGGDSGEPPEPGGAEAEPGELPQGGVDGEPPQGGAPGDMEMPPAMPPPVAPEAPLPGADGGPVPDEWVAILDDIPGYGRDTIGGRDGVVYVVTTLANDGPGSLRTGLESEDPLWIVFDDALNGTIRLEQTIYARSYKTVDARGHDIRLLGIRDEGADDRADGWGNTGISLGRPGDQDTVVRDVAFLNLTFDGNWPNPDDDGEGSDGLHLQNQVFNVWVHQCTFHNWIDGGIDARNDDDYDPMPHHISITNSHFYDIHQGLLLEAQQVTFARNHCDNLNVRCVKAVDGGNAHLVNNVIRNWRGIEIVYAKNDSMILADHNIFDPGPDSRHAGRTSGGGELQDVHNVHYRGGRYRMNDRNQVDPAFKSDAQSVYGNRKVNCEHDPVDENCWNQLYERVIAGAGAR